MIADLGRLQFFYIPKRRIGAEEIKAFVKKKKDTPSFTMHLFFLYFAIEQRDIIGRIVLTQRACDL